MSCLTKDKKQDNLSPVPSLKHQRPIELLKTCIVLFICESPHNLSFPLRLTSLAQKIKSFIATIPKHKPYLSQLLTIPSITNQPHIHHSNTSYTLNQIITASKFNELTFSIQQIVSQIASIQTTNNCKLLTLSKTIDNSSFIDIFPDNKHNKIIILNCNLPAIRKYFTYLLSKIEQHKKNYFAAKLPLSKQKPQIPKKRTWHELADQDLLFSSNFYYPLSKRRRVDIDDKQHNDKILQRIPLSLSNNCNKSIKDIQNEISDLLDYKSFQSMAALDVSGEAVDILRTPSTRQILVQNLYSTKNNNAVNEFCSHGTKYQCKIWQRSLNPMMPLLSLRECNKIHFIRIMRPHTVPTLGDCSYLDGCRHMDTCRFVHYVVDEECVAKKRPYFRARKYVNRLLMHNRNKVSIVDDGMESDSSVNTQVLNEQIYQNPAIHRYGAQWINCDVRALEFGVLNKYGVIMADPPWDIHMELPYGTLTDEEMLDLNVGQLADDNCLLFLWVTGRVMESARKCMTRWGFECQEEVLWIKTNQLQRIIRTGRTGHWLNHSKEHCLVGVKGNDIRWNRCLDCDIIVAEVRETSRKPDEIYNLMERLSPGTEKIEMFGRPHNTRPGWMTLGNQLNGNRILDHKLYKRFHELYPTIAVQTSETTEQELKEDDDESSSGSESESSSESRSASQSSSGSSDSNSESSSESESESESGSETESDDKYQRKSTK